MRRNQVTIHLTGGLGNQLFQIAAALMLNPSGVKVQAELGKPRLNKDGNPEVLTFDFPVPVNIDSRKFYFKYFSAKVAGFVLRSGVSPSRIENVKIIKVLVKVLASLTLSITGRRPILILQGSQVGYSDLTVCSRSNYLVGYFQSYKFADEVREILTKTSIRAPGPDLQSLKKAAILDRPLVVHFRFGDYLLEDNFGLPSVDYYLKAIYELWSTNKFQKIWVFSDDIDSARAKFPAELLTYVRWIDAVDESASSTLEAMREGQGFVIANSSFSWWGAYLAHSKDAPVIAPAPWFQGMESPKDLIPAYWRTGNAKA